MIEIGQKLPQFTCSSHDGTVVNNDSVAGKKTIITVFSNGATTSCNKQICSLNDHYETFKKLGYQIIGICPEKTTQNQKVVNKYHISYPLLSDPDKEVLNTFGLFGPKKFMGKDVMGVYRSAIVINENGIVTHFIDKVLSADHGNQLLETING